MLITAVTGSTAFATIVTGRPEIAKYLAFLVSVAAILDSALKWPEKARLHNDLYQRFHELAQTINENVEDTDNKLAQFQNKRLQIEVDEPTNNEILNVLCHNIQAESEGHPKSELYRISWYHRMFYNLWPFVPNSFKKYSD